MIHVCALPRTAPPPLDWSMSAHPPKVLFQYPVLQQIFGYGQDMSLCEARQKQVGWQDPQSTSLEDNCTIKNHQMP
jgi:hypothetical protein